MPKGTVFSKMGVSSSIDDTIKSPYAYGVNDICVLHETCENDFYYTALNGFMYGYGSNDTFDKYSEMESDPTKDYRFELWGGRDGLYDNDATKFIIFSDAEIKDIIDLLRQALKDAYSND